MRLYRLEDLVALAAEKRDIQLKTALERDVHLVRFDEGSIEFSLAPNASQTLPQTLMRKLQDWTGARWMVTLSRDPGAPSLRQQAEARETAARSEIETDPLVRSVLDAFPGAKVVAVTPARHGTGGAAGPRPRLERGADRRRRRGHRFRGHDLHGRRPLGREDGAVE